MGIVNKEGALYFATGIDNTGLYDGKREAMGILKAMAGEITSFDIFGGIGISAGVAFAQAAKESYNFEKQFQQSMYEVATLSSGIKGSLTEYMNSVIDMTREVPVLANESAKALYQIVSAGHDGADGMKILEVSAKAAIGGVTETATAADAITTILNGYKMGASEAERVSDLLFTTAKGGKTTMGELGKSIAQAAPIAASYGISIDEVLAAVVSITKQGVPTAEAMTKIRAAIMGASNVLGDAAFEGRTFQEALQLIYEQADGSTSKLKDLLGTDEALQAALMVTGKNAKGAAADLAEMGNAAGASERAFQQMRGSAENQTKLLVNNIFAYLRPLGKGMLAEISRAAESINDAFKDGSAQDALKDMGALITTVTTALVGYKGSILAVTTAKQIYSAVTAVVTKQRVIEAADLVLNRGLYAAEAAVIARNTSTRTLLTRAIWAQTAAQLKNAAAMLTNPYVLAAAAFAALGYAIYRVATEATAAEKAMKRFYDRIDVYNKYLSNQKERVEELTRIIKDETSSNEERHEAYKALIAISPTVFGKYKTEKDLIDNITKALKEFNQEQEKRKKLTSEYTTNVKDNDKLKELKRIKELYIKSGTKEGLSSDENAQFAELLKKQNLSGQIASAKIFGKVSKGSINFLNDLITAQYKTIGMGQAELRKQNQTSWELTLDEMSKDTIESQIKYYEELKQKFKNVKWIPIGESAPVNKDILQDRINQLKKKSSESKGGGDSVVTHDKAYWEGQKKVEEDKLAKLSDIEAAGKKGQELKRKIASYNKKISLFDAPKEDESKLREQAEQYKVLISKQKLEKIRAEEDLQMQVDEARINAMKDGSDKTIAQMELNFEKEMQAIDRQKEDLLRKKIDDARDTYNAKPGNKKGAFDGSKIKLSDEENEQFNEMYERVIDKNSNAFEGLIYQYQDYTDKRLSIEKKYDNDIRVLDEARRKASADGNSEEVARIDRAKAEATKNKGKDLMTLDYEKLKESPDYIRAFENLKYTSSETLNSLLSQLENAKSTAAKVLSPDQLREYTTSIQSIMDELEQRNPFGMLAKHKEELAASEEALATAKANLDKAKADQETVKNGGKVDVITSSYNAKTGKIDISKTYLSEAKAAERVTAATKEYSAAKDDTVKKSAKVKESEKVTTEQIKKLGGAVKEVGDAIGGEAGAIISMIGDIGTFAMTAVDGVKTAADTSATAVSTVEKASVILAIISAAIQLATKVASFFAADYSDYNKAKENYESYVKVLDVVIDKQKELIETMTGEAAIKASNQALDSIKKLEEASRRIGRERLNAGASAGSHSIGVRMINKMSSQDWADAKNALGAEFEAHNLKGNRMQGLFDLSIEQLEKLQREAPAFWGKLDEEVKGYLEKVIETGEKTQDIIDATNERFTGVSFDSFYDNWVETMLDMDSPSQDLANNLEKYLNKAIIKSMIVDKYKGDIKKLYDKFSNDAQSDGKLTESEVEQLKKQRQDLADKMFKEREELAKVFDFNSSDTSDSSRSGAMQMTQDEGRELNGRFTALQISGENIRAQNEQQTAAQLAIIEKLEFISNFSYEHQTEMCDMMVEVLDLLGKIKKDTGNLYFIRESLEKIEDKIKNL